MTKQKQRYSDTQKKKNNEKYDGCPICKQDLYYDEVTTKRIGILNERGQVNEWKCPFCKSEFDLDNNILYIYGSESNSGIA